MGAFRTAPAGTSRSGDGWQVVRARPASPEQILQLEVRVEQLGPDAAELWRRRPSVDVLARPDAARALLLFLAESGVPAEVAVPDVGQVMRSEHVHDSVRSLGPADILQHYLRHVEMNAFLEDLAARYPFVNVVSMGHSYEGRDMKALRISTGGGGRRPVILVDAGIHAREWIAPAMALYVIRQLVENADNADLTRHVDWHVIPLLNPDGYEFSHTTDRMWRKTRSHTDEARCLGVDPNRNFDFYWGVSGVSWDPCRETYAGAKPFSEAETEALAAYALTLRGRLRLYLSLHSYGGMLIHPWGFTHLKPDDSNQMMALGKLAADAIMAAGIRRFSVGNCFEMLGEVAAGGSDDWMKAVAGANYSYTLEMPVPSFTTPAFDIERYVAPTFEGIRVMGRFVSALFGAE